MQLKFWKLLRNLQQRNFQTNKQQKDKNYMHKLFKETKARKIMCVPTWQAYYLPSSHKRAHTYT